MLETATVSPSLRSFSSNLATLVRQNISRRVSFFPHFPGKSIRFSEDLRLVDAGIRARAVKARNGGFLQELDDSPVSIDLLPICSESQFDEAIAEAEQLQESVVIVWMAGWCRKCIYLKPKLQKLAAEFYPRLRFYQVDVNSVPFKLVSHAGVTRMPTIQLWRAGKKEGEVIGGQKAHFVVKDVREMIENDLSN